ncbi:MAG: hypothetical protein ACK4HF_17060 [Paracoccaceae bacterium]
MPVTADADMDFAIVIPPDDPLAEMIAEQLRGVWPGRALLVYSNLADAAVAQSEKPLLLPVADPVEALARRLAEVSESEAALAAWKSAVAPMLAAARKLRRRIWLVDAQAVASGDDATLALFAPKGKKAATRPLPARPAAIYLLLAEALLARDDEAGRYAAEIAAMRRGSRATIIDRRICDAALEQYADMARERALLHSNIALHLSEDERRAAQAGTVAKVLAEREHLRQRVATLEAEGQLLRENIGLHMDQAGLSMLQVKDGADPAPALAADRNLQKAKAEALQRRLDDALVRAGQRESVLAGVLLSDQAQLTGQDRRRAEQLEHELQSVYASRSWRITRPLRALRSGGKG